MLHKCLLDASKQKGGMEGGDDSKDDGRKKRLEKVGRKTRLLGLSQTAGDRNLDLRPQADVG